jgi:thiaminase
MAPCSRLYGFLGCQLALAYPGASHQYSHWIDTYSSPEYLVGGPCGGRGLPADAVA